MSKRFTFRSALTLVVILLSALVLVACGGDNDKKAIEDAVAGLQLPFETGDTATNVTQNLALPTTVGDVTITWSSSHPLVITTAGVVTRPAFGQSDIQVTLTATLTKGSETGEKTFTVTVKAMAQTDQQAVEAAKAALAITFATSDSASSVTANLTLPAVQGTATVTWSSNNTAVVSNAGVVTRPAAGSADVTVVLTATITKGAASDTKTFTITVKAHPVIVTDQDEVNEAISVLSIGLATGDTMSSVTGNITLPTTQNSLTVTWSSSNTSVISNTGVVTRPGKGQAAVVVTLTAEIEKGTGFGTKDFQVTVQPIPYTVEDALEAIVITGSELTLNPTTGHYTTTANITLPTSIFGFDITWSSANPAVISNTGVVVRPAYGQSDSTVVLTATVLEEEVYIVVIVSAITVKPDELIIQEAYDSLLLANIGSGVATDLTLPTTVGTEGVTVTWSSDKPDVLSNLGVVNRQPEHTTVVLTATLHYNNLTLEKDFQIVVLRFAEFVEVASVQEAIEWFQTGVSPDPEEPINYYVKVPGVTVLGRTSDGFMFGDSTGVLFAYTASVPNANWQVGQVYDIYGLLDFYFGGIQFNGIKSVSQPIQMIPSDAEVTVLTPTPVTDIVAYIATLPKVHPDKSSPFTHHYIQLTAKVRYQTGYSDDRYHTLFVNPDYVGPDIETHANSAFTDNALIVYYTSNNDAIKAFDGLTVTVNVFMYSLRDDRNLFTVVFLGDADDIQFDLTDAEVVDLAGDLATKDLPAEIIENTTLQLPSALLGTEIAWSSSDEAVINPATGVVTIPETGQVIVTLTAEITLNDVTKSFQVTIAVGELEVLSVADAKAIASGTVRVQGVVTGITTNRTFAIEDETGAIAIYIPFGTEATWFGYVGKEIDLIGTRSAHNGLLQINPVEVTVLGDATLPLSVNIDDVALDATGLLPFVTRFVTRTGLEVVGKPSQDHGNVLLNLKDPVTEELINIFWDSRVVVAGGNIADIEVGDFINLIGVPVGWSNGPRFEYTKATQIVKVEFIPETDQEKVDAAALALADQPLTITSNITLALEAAGLYGTTVTWSSNDTDVITNAGVVTVPFDPVTVTLTATVTLNDASATRVFTIEVKENVSTIAQARALASGQLVTIQGLVTARSLDSQGRVLAFIQDETGGIYLFRVPALDADKAIVGNIIRVYGTTGVFNASLQIGTITQVVVVSTDNLVEPLLVETNDELLENQGELVQVTGIVRLIVIGSSGTDVYIATPNGELRARLNNSDTVTAVVTAINDKLDIAVGTHITITGGASRFHATMQVMIFNPDQILVGAMASDAEKLAAAVGLLQLPAESDEVIVDLVLPTSTYFGATIVWESSNDAVISDMGVVTRPAAGTSNIEVTLTYTVTLNEEVFEGTLDFVVLAEVEDNGDVLNLLYTYDFGATNQTGYTAGDLTFTNADESVATITKNRAQINTHSVDNGTPALVFAPISGSLVSFVEFDFTAITDIKKVEFSLATWSGTSFTNIQALTGATFQFEFFDTETSAWVPLQTTLELTNILGQANATTYTTVAYMVTQPGMYRISYVLESASSTTNTAYAVCVDNLKIYN